MFTRRQLVDSVILRMAYAYINQVNGIVFTFGGAYTDLILLINSGNAQKKMAIAKECLLLSMFEMGINQPPQPYQDVDNFQADLGATYIATLGLMDGVIATSTELKLPDDNTAVTACATSINTIVHNIVFCLSGGADWS